MKLVYLKSTLKCNYFDVTIGIKIPFFRFSVTIEPGRSLLQFVTTNCLINLYSFSTMIPVKLFLFLVTIFLFLLLCVVLFCFLLFFFFAFFMLFYMCWLQYCCVSFFFFFFIFH